MKRSHKSHGRKFLIICATLIAALTSKAEEQADSLAPLTGNWIQQLYQVNFRINDPRIRYPKFADFCRRVYNWGDKTFNSYDPDYVVGSGKNWKATLEASGWAQNYGYLFANTEHRPWDERIIIRSNTNYDVGVRLSFMAVSIGYTLNINRLAGYNDAPRSTFNFSFTCARFYAEITSQSTEGNTYIERFGHYKDGARLHVPLDDVKTNQFDVRAYYYFNNKKYAQAAAYAFSKYQKRSAGSWLLGACYTRMRTEIDFSGLPQDMLEEIPSGLPVLSVFNFHDFEVMGGYAYNAVMPHNWVFNITLLPSAGYRRSLYAGKRSFASTVSTAVYGRTGFTYNHRAFFANFTLKGRIGFVFDQDYTFVNIYHNASLTFGVRF